MTTDKMQAAFNLPYNQSSHYWLAVFTPEYDHTLHAALKAKGMKAMHGFPHIYLLSLTGAWSVAWKAVSAEIIKHDPEAKTEVALVTGEDEPGLQELEFVRKSVAALDGLAESLWLGNAMIEDRLVCYMQPVMDRRGKVFGYEAFARVETENGVIGGGKILEAGKGLSAEYMLDRYLHVKAIASFISSDLSGVLFINFVPGFIHRPEKYLEGLTEAARFHGMPAKQLVLDFTHPELSKDALHLKSIFDYCRSKGYCLSLDDISSVPVVKKILESIRPDFIKLDIDLVGDIETVIRQGIINDIVALAHAAGATVLAEGVETEAVYQALFNSGIDLFQGYFFSAPVAVSTLKKAVG